MRALPAGIPRTSHRPIRSEMVSNLPGATWPWACTMVITAQGRHRRARTAWSPSSERCSKSSRGPKRRARKKNSQSGLDGPQWCVHTHLRACALDAWRGSHHTDNRKIFLTPPQIDKAVIHGFKSLDDSVREAYQDGTCATLILFKLSPDGARLEGPERDRSPAPGRMGFLSERKHLFSASWRAALPNRSRRLLRGPSTVALTTDDFPLLPSRTPPAHECPPPPSPRALRREVRVGWRCVRGLALPKLPPI